ncbi:hypothetical protein ACHAWF_018734 [Thalassiosira exigua]
MMVHMGNSRRMLHFWVASFAVGRPSQTGALGNTLPRPTSPHRHEMIPSFSFGLNCLHRSSFGKASRHRPRRLGTSLPQFASLDSGTEPSRSMMVDDVGSSNSVGDYFDEEKYNSFKRAVEEIVSKRNVLRDFRDNEHDLLAVKLHLLDNRRKIAKWGVGEYLPRGHFANDGFKLAESSDSHGKEDNVSYTKRKIRERCEMYMDHTGLTLQQLKLSTVLLSHLGDYCAKNTSIKPLQIAWEKILEAGLMPLSRTLSTYLYVLSLEGENGVEERDIAAEVAMYHDALYGPTEKTVALLVKSMVVKGDAAGAEALLDSIADGPLGELRHRTTSPILKLYCENGAIDSALRLYHRMRKTARVKMDAATYADFIAAVAENGYFRSDADCIVGAEDLGYSRTCGPELLDALISEMAEDALDISQESARVLHNGLAIGFKESGLDSIPDSSDIKPMSTLCQEGTLVANRVVIDRTSARCPATGTSLRLIVLEQQQRIHVHDTLVEMAREKSKEYTARLASKGRSTHDNAEKAELASQMLKEFSEWLDSREGKPYTAIVDGANVAYFGWGKTNVYQLIHMVKALEDQGETPLVVFPQKYTRKKFHLRRGMMQVLQDEEMELLDGLKEKSKMFVVPPMCLDDLCECPTS